jgi:hypothetical protein
VLLFLFAISRLLVAERFSFRGVDWFKVDAYGYMAGATYIENPGEKMTTTGGRPENRHGLG